ncbi:hypothetical protein QM012_004495 [Aureobasidium pullulans]|uniref:Fork-head domain-containing protein n=1 Tax=Aureobasidium pullulans TaxID=5580 RepID=A0ABR0TT92_AURPU
MQPPMKRRKLDSPAAIAPVDDTFAKGPDVSRQEIPESPQDGLGITQDGHSIKPIPFIQRPRFAPLLTENAEKPNDKIPTQSRFTQRPRFSSSILDMEEQRAIQSAKSTPNAQTKRRTWSPFLLGAQPGVVPRTNGKDRSSTERYGQLIGMALHSAPDNCLNTEQIYKWVIENVPEYDLESATWKDGIWVTLTVVEDFVRRDGNLEGPWTFRDGASTKYRPRDRFVSPASTTDPSAKVLHANNAQVKQGADAFAPLDPDLGVAIDDSKPSQASFGQASTSRFTKAGSETNSALPSTIEETIDIIDLTMDEDESLPPIARSQSSQKPIAARPVVSLLHGTPEEAVENKQRSSFFGLGEATWSKTASVAPMRKSLTPFTDRVLENASKETIESLVGTEKWKAANRHINNLLGSPPKTAGSTDVEATSLESPSRLPRQGLEHDFHLKEGSFEPMQIDEVRQSSPVSAEIMQQPNVEDHASHESARIMKEQVMPVHKDPLEESSKPGTTDSSILQPAQALDEMINDIETRPAPNLEELSAQEQLLDEPPSQQRLPSVGLIQQEPLYKERQAEEQLMRESLVRNYTESAAQTNSPTASLFALGTITQISLEPQASAKVAHEDVSGTAESSTQTDDLPDRLAALHSQPALPPVEQTTIQGEATKKSRLKTGKTGKRPITQAKFETTCLKLLDKMMYPTKDKWTPEVLRNMDQIWPKHLETPPQEKPDSIFFDHEAKMAEIRARPTRKQIFGKVALSRIAGNDALTKLNQMKLGKQRIDEVNIYKGYTEEQIEEEKKLNEQEGHYNTVEELLGLPQQVVPQIYEQQLAFRDYAPVSCF